MYILIYILYILHYCYDHRLTGKTRCCTHALLPASLLLGTLPSQCIHTHDLLCLPTTPSYPFPLPPPVLPMPADFPPFPLFCKTPACPHLPCSSPAAVIYLPFLGLRYLLLPTPNTCHLTYTSCRFFLHLRWLVLLVLHATPHFVCLPQTPASRHGQNIHLTFCKHLTFTVCRAFMRLLLNLHTFYIPVYSGYTCAYFMPLPCILLLAPNIYFYLLLLYILHLHIYTFIAAPFSFYHHHCVLTAVPARALVWVLRAPALLALPASLPVIPCAFTHFAAYVIL